MALDVALQITIIVDLVHNVSQALLALLRAVRIGQRRDQETVSEKQLLIKCC
jgi:hypothetical protein